MNLRCRLSLRVLQSRLIFQGRRDDAQVVAHALSDRDMAAFIVEHVVNAFQATPKGVWQDILAWILDNQDEILAFIKLLIELFASMNLTV